MRWWLWGGGAVFAVPPSINPPTIVINPFPSISIAPPSIAPLLPFIAIIAFANRSDAMCHGVRWRAMATAPEPEKVVRMLYGGVSGAIGGVGGVNTDGNNVLRLGQSGWWGCCKAALVHLWHFEEGTLHLV